MNTKFLCIVIVLLTALLIGGNQYAARSELSEENCPDCGCSVQILMTLSGTNKKKEPSCSLVFRQPSKWVKPEEGEEELAPLPGDKVTERLTDKPTRLSACQSAVICDKDVYATLKCRGDDISLNASKKYGITCQADGLLVIRANHWARKRSKTAPTRGRSPSEFSSLWSEFVGATKPATSLIWGFLPAKYSEPTDVTEAREIITGSNRWRLIDGEAGIEEGVVFVPSGEAKVQNFCTGDTVRAVGPSVISLPVCEVDISGRWRGAYVRRLTDGSLKSLAVALNLRKESGSLRGALTTPNGAFNIVEGSQSGSDIWLRAEGKVAGTKGKIELRGTLTKGDIAFDGSEQSADSKTTYRLTGFVRRLHIADSALPMAILNQPYNFTLTAFAPESQAMTFRLANPAAKQPEQITWATEAQSLRGRNGERFTYLCPPNGSLNRLYSRDNAYTDTSSICTAAVNAHVTTQAAGGVVSIEIRPGPSPDTGRFVFVSGEPQGGIRGRLPQGLSFDSKSGAFSGTPTEPGSFEISVVADDGAGTVFEQPLTLTVRRLILTNGWLPDAFVGSPYRATLKVAGGQPTYRFSGVVPNGLQLDPNTGELSGTPTSTGSGFEVTIRDRQDNSETQKVTLRVRGTTILTSYFLAEATKGVPYRAQLQAVGNSSPIRWSVDKGDLSLIGLTLNQQTGELSGTPTRAGAIAFAVRAQAADGHTRSFALTVK